MRRELKIMKGERLCDWCDRIAEFYANRRMDRETFRDIIGDVSKESYIEGVNDMNKATLGYGKNKNHGGQSSSRR